MKTLIPSELVNLRKHGKQFIPNLHGANLPDAYRGKPELTIEPLSEAQEKELENSCALGAIERGPLRLDLGKCNFCGDCARAFPSKVLLTSDYKMATTDRADLIVTEGQTGPLLDPAKIRAEIKAKLGRSLNLRQVSAGGDHSCEMELGAAGNPNFDMGRYGIHFVASPRHADGIVITGPISANMAEALQICYDAVPEPKIVVLCGVDAISGGIFAGSPALDRSFLDRVKPDLYVPGNPVHPLTFVNGILSLIRGQRF